MGWGRIAEDRLLWAGMGQDMMGLDAVGWCGTGSQPTRADLSFPSVQDMIHITVQPESQVVTEGTRVCLTCWAAGPPGLVYQWFCGKSEVRSCCATTSRVPGLLLWQGHPDGWEGACDSMTLSHLVGAWSHSPGAGD